MAFTHGRRPFVVISEYIGPECRGMARKEGVVISVIKTPNPLLSKLGNANGGFALKRSIDRTVHIVNEQKVERHAYSVNWLMDRIIEVKNREMAASELDVKAQFARLNNIAGDISQRLIGTDYRHAVEMCLTLEQMTEILKECPDLAAEPGVGINIADAKASVGQ